MRRECESLRAQEFALDSGSSVQYERILQFVDKMNLEAAATISARCLRLWCLGD